MNLNKCFLSGNLTKEPEARYTQGNVTICSFTLAVNTRYKARDGTWKDDSAFVDCTAFGGTGDAILKHFAKGSNIFVEGRLKTESWTGKDGKNHSRLKLIVEQFQFCGGKGPSEPRETAKPQGPVEGPAEPVVADGEIPF